MRNELLTFLKHRKKANLVMVILNTAVFLAMILAGGDPADVSFMRNHGAMYSPDIFERGEYYRLVTCMFLHFDTEHLLFNMLLLLFAGDMLESKMGAIRYLLIYLGGGLAGNLLSLFADAFTGNYAVSAGASGGLFAVIGALVWIVIVNKRKNSDINGKGLCTMAVLSLIHGFYAAGTDSFAHLGGFIGGFLLAAVLGIVSFPNSRRKA